MPLFIEHVYDETFAAVAFHEIFALCVPACCWPKLPLCGFSVPNCAVIRGVIEAADGGAYDAEGQEAVAVFLSAEVIVTDGAGTGRELE